MLHKPPPLFVFSRLPAVSILILRVLVFLSFFLNLVTTALHRFVSKKTRTRSRAISFRHLRKLSTKFLSVSFGFPRFSSSNQFQFYRVRCCRFSNAKKSNIRNRRRSRSDSVCLCLFVFSAIQRYSRKRLANIFFVLILSLCSHSSSLCYWLSSFTVFYYRGVSTQKKEKWRRKEGKNVDDVYKRNRENDRERSRV